MKEGGVLGLDPRARVYEASYSVGGYSVGHSVEGYSVRGYSVGGHSGRCYRFRIRHSGYPLRKATVWDATVGGLPILDLGNRIPSRKNMWDPTAKLLRKYNNILPPNLPTYQWKVDENNWISIETYLFQICLLEIQENILISMGVYLC